VRGSQACGAGAFGSRPGAGAPEDLERRLRGVVLPLQRGSLLQRAVQERSVYVGPVPPTRPNTPLFEKLGGPAPAEAALLPLLCGRHVFGILHGDNARRGRPLGDLKAKSSQQAGMASRMPQRRIATLAGGEGDPPQHLDGLACMRVGSGAAWKEFPRPRDSRRAGGNSG
jgi:hypothetical protein